MTDAQIAFRSKLEIVRIFSGKLPSQYHYRCPSVFVLRDGQFFEPRSPPNETNSGVASLLVDQGLKECPAFLSPKPAAQSVWSRRGAPAWSSIWTATRKGSPALSLIPRKKVSGCAEVSTLGAAKWSKL